MKLSRRIRDLLRANLSSPGRSLSRLAKATSPARTETRLEQIRKSLVQAVAREKQLQDALALAEKEGNEREAIRLRRELSELNDSRDQLQAVLDAIEARIEVAAEGREAPPAAATEQAQELESAPSSLAEPDEEVELDDRKARLAAPQTGQDTTGQGGEE